MAGFAIWRRPEFHGQHCWTKLHAADSPASWISEFGSAFCATLPNISPIGASCHGDSHGGRKAAYGIKGPQVSPPMYLCMAVAVGEQASLIVVPRRRAPHFHIHVAGDRERAHVQIVLMDV